MSQVPTTEITIVDHKGVFSAFLQTAQLRRALIGGLSLSDSLQRVCREFPTEHQSLAVNHEEPIASRNALLMKFALDSLPVVDASGRLAGVHRRPNKDLFHRLPAVGVIMAGGFGKRLGELTARTPKPMLSIGGRSLLERSLLMLRDAGISDFYISVFYRAEQIIEHFGDGQKWGVRIQYIQESSPLGTGGALSLIGELDEPLVVVNGDVLTELDYQAMYDYHCQRAADLTVGVRHHGFEVPYGVVQSTSGRITSLVEKPKYDYWVNAGIYLISPQAVRLIPKGEVFQMTDLIETLMVSDRHVASFPIVEYWLDIGNARDFQRAQEDIVGLRRAAA